MPQTELCASQSSYTLPTFIIISNTIYSITCHLTCILSLHPPRFRTCLRSAANSVADMVGSVFFNVVQMKCITLKQIQVCTNRSWWGRCLEYGDDYEAEVNDPFEY